MIDSYFRTFRSTQADPQIRLVAFDSGAAFRVQPLIPADALARLLRKINKEKPRAIGILADLNDQNYSAADLKTFVSSIDSSIPVFLGYLNEMELSRSAPEAFGDRLVYAPGLISRDSFNYGADSVTRRVMVQIDHVPTFYSRLATFLRGSTPESIDTLGTSRHAYIRWQGPPGTYPIHSAWSLLSPAPPDLHLENSVVIIGQVRRNQPTRDAVFTPYSRRIGDTTALEAAAHGLVTLVRDDGLRRPPTWAVVLLTVIVGLLTANLVALLTPMRGVAFLVAILAALWISGWIALKWGGWWLDLAHPAITAIAAYYIIVPFRLGLEYRRRWHFQQMSEMMEQLEALKSNFLSLVSHDLKTPIARIQGNAELLMRETLLDPKAAKSLAQIVATTEHMSDYVETILDLNRVESGKVQIHPESRDLNATIQEVAEEKSAQASEKAITLITHLEPLFSVRYDVRLMKRVFGNLVENAIKYSPENTEITISSREEGGYVLIEVKDQGFGIAPEDKEKVFGKFYRSEAMAQTGIKGTGLGLFLVKYFVELHKGGVRLESELGKGSCFQVSLPV